MPDLHHHDAEEDPHLARVTSAMREMRDLMEMRMREGFWPVPGRKQLLQSPIWHDPRVATSPDHGGKMFFLWREKGYQQAIGTTNVQPANQLKDATGSYNPGGLLQWMDLDLMMFLSALFTDRQDKIIDADQRNIFNAIGYQRLDDPPYQELRSSIKRLTGTQLWEFEETAQGEIQYRNLPPLLITTDQEKRLWVKDGRRVRLVVAIGPGWVSEVRADNQVVDLNSYLYLVREIRNGDAMRRKMAQKRFANKQLGAPMPDATTDEWRDIDRPPDMARAVLLFCDSLRRQQNDKSFITIAKTDWLMERFADRHTPIPYVTSSLDLDQKVKLISNDIELSSSRKIKEFFGDVRRPDFKYLDLLHENGKIRRSLDALAKLRIFKHYQVEGDKIIIEWNDPKNLPRLEIRNRELTWNDTPSVQVGYTTIQRKFIVQDKLTGVMHFVDSDGDQPDEAPPAARQDSPPVLPPPTGTSSVHSTQGKESNSKPTQADVGRSKPTKPSVLDGLDQAGMSESQIANLRRLHAYFALPPKQVKAAAAAGWTARMLMHLYTLVLWFREQGEIRNHVAFAISELANADPMKYSGDSIRKIHGPEMIEKVRVWIFGPKGPLGTSEEAPSTPAATASAPPAPSGPRSAHLQAPASSVDISAVLFGTLMPVLKRRHREVKQACEEAKRKDGEAGAALIAERDELFHAMEDLGSAIATTDEPSITAVHNTAVELLTATHADVRAAAAGFLAKLHPK